MNIIFMGTPECAIPSLQIILDNQYQLTTVITQPDKPKGRKQVLESCPVKNYALSHGLTVHTPISIRKDPPFIQMIENELRPDLMVVVAFGQILPPALLSIPKYGCINLHFSLLPKYRGAAPVSWAIINGDIITGVSTMYMNEKMDEGDIILQEEVPVQQTDTRGILESRLADIGAELLLKTIRLIESNQAPRSTQHHPDATFAPKVTTAHGKLDWTKTAVELNHIVRGLNPDPMAYTFFAGQRVRILETAVNESLQILKSPGEIVSIEKNQGILVQTGNGALILKSLQPEGKKPMGFMDFANGRKLTPGQHFE